MSVPSIPIIAATMQEQQKQEERADPLITRRGDSTTRSAGLKESNDTKSSPSVQIVRQQMQEKLYELIQTRCSVEHPKAEAIALEKLLFRSLDGNTDSYREFLNDSSVIASQLKEVGKRILLRSIRKRRLGGFRSKMVLTKVPAKAPSVSAAPEEKAKADSRVAMDPRRLDDKEDDQSSCIGTEKSTTDELDDDDNSELSAVGSAPEGEQCHQMLLASLIISNLRGNDLSDDVVMDFDEEDEKSFSNIAAV